jgi:hypothetical protein
VQFSRSIKEWINCTLEVGWLSETQVMLIAAAEEDAGSLASQSANLRISF